MLAGVRKLAQMQQGRPKTSVTEHTRNNLVLSLRAPITLSRNVMACLNLPSEHMKQEYAVQDRKDLGRIPQPRSEFTGTRVGLASFLAGKPLSRL